MKDPCCTLCKGPHGICLSRHACEHHRIADAQDEINHQTRKLYRNPTADQAIANAMNSRRKYQ